MTTNPTRLAIRPPCLPITCRCLATVCPNRARPSLPSYRPCAFALLLHLILRRLSPEPKGVRKDHAPSRSGRPKNNRSPEEPVLRLRRSPAYKPRPRLPRESPAASRCRQVTAGNATRWCRRCCWIGMATLRLSPSRTTCLCEGERAFPCRPAMANGTIPRPPAPAYKTPRPQQHFERSGALQSCPFPRAL